MEEHYRAKRAKVGDYSYNGESMGTADEGLAHPPEPSSNKQFVADPASAPSVATSEASNTDVSGMLSTLVPKDVLQWYKKAEEKLREDLKQVSMEDHEWELRSWDQGGVGVVKLFCLECRVPIGGSIGKHTKNTVTNLFSNFRKSHLNSVGHVRNYCRKKGVDLANHPQAGSSRSNPVVITSGDHKKDGG